MTSRCRIPDRGEAIGSSILYLGGQALTIPRVSTSTTLSWAGEFSRSRPPDLQIHFRRFGPMSSPSPATHTYKCAPGGLPMSSWKPPTRSHKKEASNDSPFIDRIRARYDGQSYGYGTGYYCCLTACRDWSRNLWWHYVITAFNVVK